MKKDNSKITKDCHTHIGQFNQTYYDYHNVFNALLANGIKETICAYLTPKFDNENDALDFYYYAIDELEKAKQYAHQVGLQVHFLVWLDPVVLKYGISIDEIYFDFDYDGIVIHPFLNDWGQAEEHLLDEVFLFCEKYAIKIYMHTGVSERDNPLLFEKWFAAFPKVQVSLAHCKDPEPIIELFSRYKNLTGDTAFCPDDSYQAICNAGFQNRMDFGTDFPITHWYEKGENTAGEISEAELRENYKKTLREKKI